MGWVEGNGLRAAGPSRCPTIPGPVLRGMPICAGEYVPALHVPHATLLFAVLI